MTLDNLAKLEKVCNFTFRFIYNGTRDKMLSLHHFYPSHSSPCIFIISIDNQPRHSNPMAHPHALVNAFHDTPADHSHNSRSESLQLSIKLPRLLLHHSSIQIIAPKLILRTAGQHPPSALTHLRKLQPVSNALPAMLAHLNFGD